LKSITGEFYFIKEDFISGNFPKESEELHPFFMGHYTGPLVKRTCNGYFKEVIKSFMVMYGHVLPL